ncbi:MAG: type II/IV secretion system protein [Gammaproteobacteria bacterium]|nr:type II/IV secretion system protein [Gammaproteobacteria bacterium]
MSTSSLIQNLLDYNLASKQELKELLNQFNNDDFEVAQYLFENAKLINERKLIGKAFGDSINTAHIHLEKSLFQETALEKFDKEMVKNLVCIPIYIFNKTLTVAVSDPLNKNLVEKISKICGMPISPVFAFPSEIENSIAIQYGSGSEIEDLSNTLSEGHLFEENMDIETLKQLSQKGDIIRIVNGLLLLCLKHEASDIHIQPMTKKISIRFRIDGLLQELVELNHNVLLPIISRLKVMANLDITEKRLPQDGQLELTLKNRSFPFRLSTVPSVLGEKAVIRALGSANDSMIMPMEELGLSQHNQALLEKVISRPNGVLYVTGPTGSGKTTTLYSILGKLHNPEINIITVEDPVEITLDGVTQIQANKKVGLDFTSALRSILRQDPEVILIGEIRDLETAKIASEAALTGHLVMSTLHTNDSIQAIVRLIELGLEPHLVAPSVYGVVAQRLVRRICDHCKESYTPSQDVVESLFYNIGNTPVTFYRGRGCKDCNHTGYSRRVAIHEVMLINDEIRDQIAKNASIIDMKREATQLGLRSLKYDGILKVLRGLTTLEEINRVAGD